MKLKIIASVGVFLATVVIVWVFWVILPAGHAINESTDYIGFYQPVANNILNKQVFRLPNGTPAVQYPPGYPLILAGIFGLANLGSVSHSNSLAAFLLICAGISSVLLFTLAQMIWKIYLAFFVAFTWITYPLFLWLTKQPNSELVFLVFFLGSITLLWHNLLNKKRKGASYLVVGVLIGMTMLIRPIAIGLGLVVGGIIWFTQKEIDARTRLWLVALVLAGNIIVILPWQVWLVKHTGQMTLLSTNSASSIRDGLTFAINSEKPWREGVDISQDLVNFMQTVDANQSKLQSSSDIGLLLLRQAHTHPLTILKLLFLKSGRSWYATDSHRFETPILILQTFYLLLILWGCFSTWKNTQVSKSFMISLWVIAIYFWLVTILVLSIARYMVPAIALLFVLLPGILVNVNQWIKKLKRQLNA